jgi:phage terminase large subunit-like protein
MQRGPSPLIAPAGAPAIMSFVADTAFDMRAYSIEGPSGFLNVGPAEHRPRHHPGWSTLEWANGAKALLFSAEDPDSARGASGSLFWVDELAKAKRADLMWTNMLFGMREGNPRGIVTTTPRPIPLLKKLMKAPSTHVTVGSTWDNRENLSETYYREVIEPLAGTRLGRQEIAAEILEDLPGALWTRAMVDRAREAVKVPDMSRIVVAVDPSGARAMSDTASASIGIVVAGRGIDGRGYVLADRSCKLSPAGWARRAIDAYHEFEADRIVAERNFGGAMVEYTIRSMDEAVSYSEVVASRGKVQRAEPIAALYERGLISHVAQDMLELEDQCCQMATDGFMGEGSPDRVDALVWGLSELLVTGSTYDHSMSWVS